MWTRDRSSEERTNLNSNTLVNRMVASKGWKKRIGHMYNRIMTGSTELNAKRLRVRNRFVLLHDNSPSLSYI